MDFPSTIAAAATVAEKSAQSPIPSIEQFSCPGPSCVGNNCQQRALKMNLTSKHVGTIEHFLDAVNAGDSGLRSPYLSCCLPRQIGGPNACLQSPTGICCSQHPDCETRETCPLTGIPRATMMFRLEGCGIAIALGPFVAFRDEHHVRQQLGYRGDTQGHLREPPRRQHGDLSHGLRRDAVARP